LPGSGVTHSTGGIELVVEPAAAPTGIRRNRIVAADVIESIADPFASSAGAAFASDQLVELFESTAVIRVAGFGAQTVVWLTLPEGICSSCLVGNLVRVAQKTCLALAVFAAVRRAEAPVVLGEAQVRETAAFRVSLTCGAEDLTLGYAQAHRIRPSGFEQSARITVGALISTQLSAYPLTLAVDVDAIARLTFGVALADVAEPRVLRRRVVPRHFQVEIGWGVSVCGRITGGQTAVLALRRAELSL